MNWTKVSERMPEPGRIVLAYYRNEHGKSRRVRAEWVPAKHEIVTGSDDFGDGYGDYDEDEDEYYWPEGWYELIDNWEDYSAVRIHYDVTHWTPLPDGPEED